jgi:hypothetical protein
VTPKATCAIAKAILMGDKAIGALVVKSTHYDLSVDGRGRYLERLAKQLGDRFVGVHHDA